MTDALAQLDKALDAARPIDHKTDELIRFALSIKARSAPCVRKHFVGAKAAGASDDEIGYVFALTMREAAGADDCWTHDVISGLADPTDAADPINAADRAEGASSGVADTGCCG